MRVPRHDADRRLAIAMTPMIDVVFLLLVFFLVTASFDTPEQSLPADAVVSSGVGIEAPIEPPPELERIVIRGWAEGSRVRWEVNGAPCPTLADLRGMVAQLAAIDPGLPIVFEPGDGVPLGELVTAYDACRMEGLTQIRFTAAVE